VGPWVIALIASATTAPPLVDVPSLDQKFLIDIRYATPDNFFKKAVYSEARCLLRPSVAAKMVKAQRWLDQNHPGLRLLFKDCYRPHRVQFVLWDAVKGTEQARYVANPNTKVGSIHSYGAAVDLTLADAAGVELDMGTPYDFLGRLAEPRHEAEYLKKGTLTADQVKRRKILRRAMTEAGGMRMIPNEWWHFDELSREAILDHYQRLDFPFSAVPRDSR
jgi:zinc D-Ala-D-Ala dipeptidase